MLNPLNQKYAPKAQPSFEPIPKGKYRVRVKTIRDWAQKPVQKDVKVYAYDDDYKKVMDENGKEIFEITDIITYSSEIDFEILEGPFTGRIIKHWLNLHPNTPWNVPAFIDACGVVEDIFPSEIKTYCEGAEVMIDVIISEGKEQTKTNPKTGIQETLPARERNEVRKVSAVDVEV